MAVQAEPSPEGAAVLPQRWRERFRALDTRERWGYAVWLLVGLVISVPETWAAVGTPPWPTISTTVGHLETLWSPVAVIVVALIAAAAYHAVRYPLHRSGVIGEGPVRRVRGRTVNGRYTKSPEGVAEISAYAYFSVAIGVIVAATVVAAATGASRWVVAYVLYGLIAVFCVIIPNVLAYWFSADVPFPTLFRTVANLERRWHPAAIVVVAGLAVLLVHLALYPWPDIFRTVSS